MVITKTKMSRDNLIHKWKNRFQLTDWEFQTQEILPDQVVYDDDCPDEDKYFVGIEIDQLRRVGTIHHDRELTEKDIVHELLHVKYPNKNEDWINDAEELLTNINR